MQRRNSTARVMFIVISVLLLLSMILGFVVMLLPSNF